MFPVLHQENICLVKNQKLNRRQEIIVTCLLPRIHPNFYFSNSKRTTESNSKIKHPKKCLEIFLSYLGTLSSFFIQYNTIQYNTTQYNTIQYNTIQYNTIQCVPPRDKTNKSKRKQNVFPELNRAIPLLWGLEDTINFTEYYCLTLLLVLLATTECVKLFKRIFILNHYYMYNII